MAARQDVMPSCEGNRLRKAQFTVNSGSGTSDVAIFAAPGAGLFTHITDLYLTLNGAASTGAYLFNLKDGSTVLWTESFPLAATTTRVQFHLSCPGGIRLSANAVCNVNVSVALNAGDIRVFAAGYVDNE